MSALHNWIIDAERYRILLSRHLSPSYFNLCHPSLSPSTHSSLQTQNAITGFISIFRLLFLICEHSVISFLKKALYHTLYHTFFSFYSAQALCIKLWLDQILHSMTLRKGKNEKTAYSSAVTAHSGYSITVCWWGSLCERFPIKKKWWPLWKESLSWNTFGVRLILQSRLYGGCTDPLLVTINK